MPCIVTLAYSQRLCAPLGGILGISTNATSTNTTSTGVTPFTGGAVSLYIGRPALGFVVGMMGWFLWTL